uniref:GAG-pre-integrase domain-containing protein n=1 Tax=Peronospora matthiolae TaxID=2874970 RepID=A0AAV1TUN5_9STRA
MADGESLRLTRVGSNIVSYGKPKSKGFALVYEGDNSALARRSDGTVAFDVAFESNMLYVETTATRGRHSAEDAIMDALEEREMEADADGAHEASLLHWHHILGHLAFDSIERIAHELASGIRMTSKKRMACVSCLEGK